MAEEQKEIPLWKRLLLKLTSFKNIIALWAMVMFTWMLVTKQPEFKELGWGLLSLVGGDVVANVVQKKLGGDK